MTSGITLCKCPMYFLHSSGVNDIQNSSMPFINSSKLVGLYDPLKYFLNRV